MASDHGGVDWPGAAPVWSDSGAKAGVPSSRSTVREARLRPELAGKYVGIEPGIWFSAAGLAEQLITKLLREGVSDQELPQRVLDTSHFEFRGGDVSASRSATPKLTSG